MNWAIIGAGNISNTFSNNLIQVNGSKILSIASKDKDKLKRFSKKFNVQNENIYNNYDDIINSDFDVAYVGLINSLHNEIIKKLAFNNKNILVEKPAFLSLKDYDQTLNVIKKQNVFFMESMMYLHHPQINKIFEIIKNNEIGELYKFEYKLGFDIRKKFLGFFRQDINFLNRLSDPKLGGGAINDIGCYPISFSNKLANIFKNNKIKKIKKNNYIGKTGVDEKSSINIEYENNFMSDLLVSINEKQDCRAIISGSKGKIIVPNLITPSKHSHIILIKNNKQKIFFNTNDLYTYIVKDVQNYIKDGIKEPQSPGLNWTEMRNNIEILEKWKAF